MRPIAIAIAFAFIVVAQPLAQQTPGAGTAEQLRRAERKITIGLVMMGVGALAAPLTSLARRQGDPGGPVITTSISAIIVGGGLVWWGAVEHRKASNPQIGVGITFGRNVGVQIHRSW